jgi:hypothetical protein
MTYSLVGQDAGCGELELFFVADRLGVDFFLAALSGGLSNCCISSPPVELLHFKS